MSQKFLKNSIISEIKNSSLRKSNFAALFYLRIHGTSSSCYCEKSTKIWYKISKVNTQARFASFNLIFNMSQLKYLYYSKMYMWVSNVTAY